MSDFKFGNASNERLDTVDNRLAAVVRLALELSSVDFMVLEGRRSVSRQHELYGQGRSTSELRAAGVNPEFSKPGMKRVTWTLKSNHFTGRAVDLVPWPVDWDDTSKFDAIAKAMFAAAKGLSIPIRWGADWDRDGNPREAANKEYDSPHFELAPEVV